MAVLVVEKSGQAAEPALPAEKRRKVPSPNEKGLQHYSP
jgi:hypothetical protein